MSIDPKVKQELEHGFAGESMANRRYLFFARKAEEEINFAPSAEVAELLKEIAELFRETAEEETAHAYAHLVAMGGIGDTLQNLQTAFEGETYEYTTMYPASAEAARAAGREDIARQFESTARAERRHAARYERTIQRLKEALERAK
jgi:rubrerythrin